MDNNAIRVKGKLLSMDGSEKYLFATTDGELFEGVKFKAPSALNLCLSSQIGCSFHCTHCATGLLPFKRNLTSKEILQEAQIIAERCSFDVLFLGMGEPFLNLRNILESIDLMITDGGLAGYDHVLIGTSGIPGLSKSLSTLSSLSKRPQLSFSIHGVPDSVRSKIIPQTSIYGLQELERDLTVYQEETGDKVTLNYNLLDDMNDSDLNFTSFALWAKKFDCIVRIIPWNSVPGVNFQPSKKQREREFFRVLENHGVPYIYRPNYGTDALGGCGQLGVLGYVH